MTLHWVRPNCGLTLNSSIFRFYSIRSELSDTIMNVVGSFMWVAVGGTALHYWQGYMAAYDQVVVVREQVVIMQFFFSPN